MGSTIQRNAWADDTGTPGAPAGDGTLLTNDELQAVYDAIDEMFAGAAPFDWLTIGGRLRVDGFGPHFVSAGGSGLNGFIVRNTLAGSTNYASLILGNDAAEIAGALSTLSSAFTSVNYNVRDSTVLVANRSGGLSVAALLSDIRFYAGAAGTAERLRVWASGALSINDLYDAGAPGLLNVFTAAGGTHQFYATGVGRFGFSVWHRTAGATNYASLMLGNDASASAGELFVTSTTFTPSGSSHTDSLGIVASRPGGLGIVAAHAAGAIRFYAGGAATEALAVGADGFLYERGRAVAMGVWTDVPHHAGNYTADSGTWTVQAGDQYALRYCVVHEIMYVQFTLSGTSTASAGNELRITIPAPYVAADYNTGVAFAFAVPNEICFIAVRANPTSNTISIQRFPPTAWGDHTNDLTILGTVFFKVT